MEMQSSPESKSEVITTQGSVKAFMEMILNTSLPLKPSLDPPIDLQQLIAKQVHAVVVLYNYYQRKRHPELEFLEFESFCRLAANLQPELVPYMRGMHQSDYNSSDVSEDQLSLTEKAIMDACKVCLALYDVPEHMPIKEEWPISKIVVMLVDPSKENCLNIFGSVTRGVWSFLEQSIDSCKISLEGTAVRKKRRRISIKDTREEQNTTEAGYKQLAVSAIKNFTGLKKTELVFLESHVVYSVSKEKTAARFYIVKCAVKFPEKLNITYWVPMKEVVESLQGPLANWLRHIGEWTPTLVTQSYHLLPYAKILSNYFSSKVSSGCLNDSGVMVSTSNSNTNESSDATIMSSDKEDMAGPTCSVSRLHTLDKDKTDAVPTPKEDKTKNDCTARKVYQHYRKRTSTRRDVTVSTLSVKDKTHQLRNLGDEIAICDKNIQTISDNRCSDVRVKGKAVQDGTFQHGKDQVFSEQVKGKSIIEALIPDQISCQVLDRICHDQKWTSPTYSISPCDGGYIANVTVKGDDFEWLVNDRVHSCLKEAKDSAAMQMIEKLRSFVTNDWFFVI